jgi:DUF1680 family protein
MQQQSVSRTHVVDVSASPFAQLRPVPIAAVKLGGNFWAPRIDRNLATALPTQYALLESTGRLNNFRRVIGTYDGPFAGIFFNDSDIYKWLEAASWALLQGPNPQLSTLIDEAIALVEAAQQPDGYINTWFALERAHLRWTALRDEHELYCGGHLIQAAVAHHRTTGSERLLNVARRFADLLIEVFGPESEGKLNAVDGHEEVEMALVELARDTGERKYLELARFFIEARGQGYLVGGRWGLEYFQDHVPFRKMKTLGGHAVRAMYMACGVTDLYLETGEEELLANLERLWTNMTTRRMYISGGLGARHDGESFGGDFELPNARAYTETCAAIGSMMWNHRLLAATGKARYADLIEWTLFNGMLPGWSLGGDEYFYVNPLANEGDHTRQKWYEVSCCPPNVARTLGALPGYMYATSNDREIWVHLYAESDAEVVLGNQTVRLVQRTEYPWDGAVSIEVQGEGEFTLKLRIPGWCTAGATVSVNGLALPASASATAGSYFSLTRLWRSGDRVQLSLPMPIRIWESHPAIAENAQRVALSRGPMLYCVEDVDHAGTEPDALSLGTDANLQAAHEPKLLGGVVVLRGTAHEEPRDDDWQQSLYRPAQPLPTMPGRSLSLTAVPYYTWQNRGPSKMRVWLRRAD